MPSRLTPSHVGNCSVNGVGVCLSWKTVWRDRGREGGEEGGVKGEREEGRKGGMGGRSKWREGGRNREGELLEVKHKHSHVGNLLGTLMVCLLFLLS